MADASALLAAMHAMREPPPPTPLAPYLATAALGAICALAAAYILWRGRQRVGSVKRAALDALASSRRLSQADRLAAQAKLLRRVVRTAKGERLARARGSDWLGVLDQTFRTSFFTEGDGRIFADGLYQRQRADDLDAIDRSLGDLIARVRP